MKKYILALGLGASVAAAPHALPSFAGFSTLAHAQAANEACSAINFSFSTTQANAGGQSTQNYDLNAGDILNFAINGVAGAAIEIQFAGATIFTGTIPANGQLNGSYTTPNRTRGLLTAIIQGNTPGQTTTVGITCTPVQQNAVVQQPNINAHSVDHLLGAVTQKNSLLRRVVVTLPRVKKGPCDRRRDRLEGQLVGLINALGALGEQLIEPTFRLRQRTAEAIKAVRGDIARLERQRQTVVQIFNRDRSNEAAISGGGLDRFNQTGTAIVELIKKRQEQLAELLAFLDIVVNDPCVGGSATSNYFPLGYAEPSSTTNGNSPFSIVSGSNDLSFTSRFGLTEVERVWNFGVSGAISGLNDGRNGADRNARLGSFTFGASTNIGERSLIGIGGGYQRGRVTSDALAAELETNLGSVATVFETQINEFISAELATGYGFGNADIEMGGETGDFAFQTAGINARISAQFERDLLTLSPFVSGQAERIWREQFTTDQGTVVDDSQITHSSIGAGLNITSTFRDIGGIALLQPTIGVDVTHAFLSETDFNLVNGTQVGSAGTGIGLSGGVNFVTNGGVNLGINGRYSWTENNVDSWTIGANLTIPLN